MKVCMYGLAHVLSQKVFSHPDKSWFNTRFFLKLPSILSLFVETWAALSPSSFRDLLALGDLLAVGDFSATESVLLFSWVLLESVSSFSGDEELSPLDALSCSCLDFDADSSSISFLMYGLTVWGLSITWLYI